MSADLTLVNLNMLFMRYGEQVERERHVPLGASAQEVAQRVSLPMEKLLREVPGVEGQL